MAWISAKTRDYLENEIDYWRDQAQKQQARADRAVDRLLESVHSMPVSELGLGEAKSVASELEKKLAAQMREVDEIHNEDMNDLAESNSGIL